MAEKDKLELEARSASTSPGRREGVELGAKIGRMQRGGSVLKYKKAAIFSLQNLRNKSFLIHKPMSSIK